MRRRTLPWLVLALTVLAGAGAAFAADDEADSRLRYAREALLAQARAAVGGEATDSNLEPLRDALGREEEALRTWKAKGAALPPDERAAWTGSRPWSRGSASSSGSRPRRRRRG